LNIKLHKKRILIQIEFDYITWK